MPASPDAGCIHNFTLPLKCSTIFEFATQFSATPPAKHKLFRFVSLIANSELESDIDCP